MQHKHTTFRIACSGYPGLRRMNRNRSDHALDIYPSCILFIQVLVIMCVLQVEQRFHFRSSKIPPFKRYMYTFYNVLTRRKHETTATFILDDRFL
jgi:hypothetical protein